MSIFARKLIGGGYDPDANRLFSRMTVAPTTARKRIISDTIRSLKRTGVWGQIVLLYVYAAHDKQASLLNWRSNAYDLVLMGSNTDPPSLEFVANSHVRPVAFSSNSAWLEAAFPAGSSPLFAPTSAHLSAMNVTNGSTAAFAIATLPNTNNGYLAPNSPGQAGMFGNQFDIASNAVKVQHLVTRTGIVGDTYADGALTATGSKTGTSDTATSVQFLRSGSSFAVAPQGRMASLGLGMTAQQVADFKAALNFYMNAIGAPS